MRRAVNPDQKISYAVVCVILALLLLVLLVPAGAVRYVTAGVLVLSAVAVCLFVKKRSILSFNKRQILFLLAVVAALYLMLLYLAGIHFGYHRRLLVFSSATLLRYILPIAVVIIATEIIRAVLLAQNSKLISCLLFAVCVTAELAMDAGYRDVRSIHGLMDFIAMTAFPAVTSNILYHYISKRYGMYPNMVYRFIITLYVYIIPVAPAVPQVMEAFCNLLLPLAAMLFMDVLFEKKRKRATQQHRGKWAVAGWGLIVVVMISVVMLISCQFRYGILVIATESMTGELNKGDAVLYEEYKGQVLAEGDIIVFSKDGESQIIHRVVAIQRINGQNRYYTKGDANKDLDYGYVTDGEVVGVVQLKIVYIGHPSLWLRELFD